MRPLATNKKGLYSEIARPETTTCTLTFAVCDLKNNRPYYEWSSYQGFT